MKFLTIIIDLALIALVVFLELYITKGNDLIILKVIKYMACVGFGFCTSIIILNLRFWFAK